MTKINAYNATIPMNLGEKNMQQKETLKLAEAIRKEKEDNGKTYKMLESIFNLTRPHIINHLKLLSLPDRVKRYYLEGHMNFKPLLDAHDLYGESLVTAMDLCIKTNSKIPERKSRKVTLPQIKALMSPVLKSATSSSENKAPVQTEAQPIPTDSIDKQSISADITAIKRILHESEKSSSGYSALLLSTHSNTLIHGLLKSIESELTLNSEEINHSVIFNSDCEDMNTYPKPSIFVDDFDQTPQINFEDISQDSP